MTGFTRALARLEVELLIWLPVLLVFASEEGPGLAVGAGLAAAAVFALGRAVYLLPVTRRRMALLGLFLLCMAAGAALFGPVGPVAAFGLPPLLGAVAWRGRYRQLTAGHYGLAIGLCAAAVIYANAAEAAAGYRAAFIAGTFVWTAVWFLSLNYGLLVRSGVHGGIATLPVRRASRKYLYLFMGAGLVLVGLTISYGQRLLRPRELNLELPESTETPSPEPSPSMPEQQPGMPPLEPGEPWIGWEILTWAMYVALAALVLWALWRLWQRRSDIWRALVRKIRDLLLRELKEEALPYTEERRSLAKQGRKGGGPRSAAHRKPGRKPANWERMSNAAKVRYIYEDAVLAGIGQGYRFRADLTPEETLAEIERWENDHQARFEREKAIRARFGRVRTALRSLYGKARYGNRDIADEEADGLLKEWESK